MNAKISANMYQTANAVTHHREIKPKYSSIGRAGAVLCGVLSVLCALGLFALPLFAQDFKTVHDGIEYAEVVRDIAGQTVRMNLLRLDLTKVRVDVVHAMDKAIGTEATSSIARHRGAVAAINAGFFRLDKSAFAGDAAGVLMIDGKVLSEGYQNRIALLIRNGPKFTDVSVNHLNVDGFLTVGREVFYEVGVDRERKENDLLIFTPEFGDTTMTSASGDEIVVQNGRITEVIKGKGNARIPANGFVISASGARAGAILDAARPGANASIKFLSIGGPNGWKDADENAAPFEQAEDIVGGVPQLVRGGKVNISWESEKTSRSFVDTRHPRTAVAKLRDGKLLMITVDGRSEASGGIGLYDLAAYLLELGAVDAMNLDGGGSTTMFLDGKVVNHPSDKEGERKVSDALIVSLRQTRTSNISSKKKNGSKRAR